MSSPNLKAAALRKRHTPPPSPEPAALPEASKEEEKKLAWHVLVSPPASDSNSPHLVVPPLLNAPSGEFKSFGYYTPAPAVRARPRKSSTTASIKRSKPKPAVKPIVKPTPLPAAASSPAASTLATPLPLAAPVYYPVQDPGYPQHAFFFARPTLGAQPGQLYAFNGFHLVPIQQINHGPHLMPNAIAPAPAAATPQAALGAVPPPPPQHQPVPEKEERKIGLIDDDPWPIGDDDDDQVETGDSSVIAAGSETDPLSGRSSPNTRSPSPRPPAPNSALSERLIAAYEAMEAERQLKLTEVHNHDNVFAQAARGVMDAANAYSAGSYAPESPQQQCGFLADSSSAL